jgi:hypothetical protein
MTIFRVVSEFGVREKELDMERMLSIKRGGHFRNMLTRFLGIDLQGSVVRVSAPVMEAKYHLLTINDGEMVFDGHCDDFNDFIGYCDDGAVIEIGVERKVKEFDAEKLRRRRVDDKKPEPYFPRLGKIKEAEAERELNRIPKHNSMIGALPIPQKIFDFPAIAHPSEAVKSPKLMGNTSSLAAVIAARRGKMPSPTKLVRSSDGYLALSPLSVKDGFLRATGAI